MVPSSTSPSSSPAASSPHPLPQPAAARISIREFPPRLEVVVEDPVARARVPAVMAAVVVGLLASAAGVDAAGRPGTISIPTDLAPSLGRGLLRPPTDAVVVAAVRPRMIRDPRPRLGEGAIDETATMTMMSDAAAVAMTVTEVIADLVAVVVDIVSISELQTFRPQQGQAQSSEDERLPPRLGADSLWRVAKGYQKETKRTRDGISSRQQAILLPRGL